MKKIFDGDSMVKTIMGAKKVKPGCVYRWSCFTVPYTHNDRRYIFNNFSKVCFDVEPDELDLRTDARFTSEQAVADENLSALVSDLFLVPEDEDEAVSYEKYSAMFRAMRTNKKGYSSYTILPTTACNARCFYCFEEGMKFVTMSDETVSQTIEFIKKTRNPGNPVNFAWFGGEPLAGERIIDRICAAMREENIEFKSKMVSNGSLITEKIIQKMKNDWNLGAIQITLDGVEEEYNRRKNYVFNYASAYWHVLSRIKLINENGIKLNIRVNVDEGNIDGLPQMAEDVKCFVPNTELVTFDLTPLFDIHEVKDDSAIWQKSFEISQRLEAMGFKAAAHYSVSRTKVFFCMADSPYSSVAIAPDGRLYPCEDISNIGSLGDVFEGVTNRELVNSLQRVEKTREQCRGCFSLPQCTTFSRCKNRSASCRYYSRKRLERALSHKLDSLTDENDDKDTEMIC